MHITLSTADITTVLGVKTLALPAVSAGIFGWPARSAADIAVGTLRRTASGVVTATFCLVEPRLYKAFGKATAAEA